MLLNLLTPFLTLIIFILILIWLLILTLLYLRSERRFLLLTQGTNQKDLRSVLEQLQHTHDLTTKELAQVHKTLKDLSSDAAYHIQNIGFLRYNPFSDTGGDQSFCLSLLDRHGTGVVVSSLHSRDLTRIYAKKIVSGKSPGHTLSKEERAVINQALKP